MSAASTLDQIRAMKGRATMRVGASGLSKNVVIRVDGVKYAVSGEPETQQVTGSVMVPVYSEHNQHDSLYLSPGEGVGVLGVIEGS